MTLKKLASCIFAFVLCASLFALPSVAFAQSGTYVFDEQNLFTESEFNNLESQAEALASKYNMGVYLLTVDSINGKKSKSDDDEKAERTRFTENYYRNNGLGLGSNHDGIIFVIASGSREYNTGALGQGSYSFSDRGIEKIEDAATSHLKNSDWYGAAEAYYSEVGDQLAYYESHGKPYKPLTLFDILIRIAIILGIPGAITFVMIKSWRSEMLTAVEQSEASNYLDPNSVQVTESSDTFIHTTMVATPIPKEEKSSGGGWGGGGGGGFSSSGGGKF